MNRCVVSLGSNVIDKQQLVNRAGEALRLRFEEVALTVAELTPPIGDISSPEYFLNQVAFIRTAYTAEEILPILKEIEYELGRRPGGGISGQIMIDIDLLQWNDYILKPEDMDRPYIKDAISLADYFLH